MNYFDYLRLTRKEDTRDTFIEYLVSILDYTEKNAIEYSKLYYGIFYENGGEE